MLGFEERVFPLQESIHAVFQQGGTLEALVADLRSGRVDIQWSCFQHHGLSNAFTALLCGLGPICEQGTSAFSTATLEGIATYLRLSIADSQRLW